MLNALTPSRQKGWSIHFKKKKIIRHFQHYNIQCCSMPHFPISVQSVLCFSSTHHKVEPVLFLLAYLFIKSCDCPYFFIKVLSVLSLSRLSDNNVLLAANASASASGTPSPISSSKPVHQTEMIYETFLLCFDLITSKLYFCQSGASFESSTYWK